MTQNKILAEIKRVKAETKECAEQKKKTNWGSEERKNLDDKNRSLNKEYSTLLHKLHTLPVSVLYVADKEKNIVVKVEVEYDEEVKYAPKIRAISKYLDTADMRSHGLVQKGKINAFYNEEEANSFLTKLMPETYEKWQEDMSGDFIRALTKGEKEAKRYADK